jgi:hypothetical protein
MDMHQEYSIGKTLQLLKGESAYWINKEKLTRSKFEWADEYYAVSVDAKNITNTRMYILGQDVHHQKVSFQEEYDELIKGFGF